MYKILSVDFDFFQNIYRKEDLGIFSSIDYSPSDSLSIWRTHYYNNPDIFNIVSIDTSSLNKLEDILSRQRTDIPVSISYSHSDIYYFINRIFHKQDDIDCTNIDLTNLDFHHDIINDNSELDCGNWIGTLIRDRRIFSFRWIAREMSMKMYGLDEDFINSINYGKGNSTIEFDFKSIEDTKFDAIFICRSDPWTCPHLDNYFLELVNLCKSRFNKNLDIESIVEIPREI